MGFMFEKKHQETCNSRVSFHFIQQTHTVHCDLWAMKRNPNYNSVGIDEPRTRDLQFGVCVWGEQRQNAKAKVLLIVFFSRGGKEVLDKG